MRHFHYLWICLGSANIVLINLMICNLLGSIGYSSEISLHMFEPQDTMGIEPSCYVM